MSGQFFRSRKAQLKDSFSAFISLISSSSRAESSTITPEGFTAADLADCAEREVRQRQRAYPRWVEAGRMTQQLSDRQSALMQAIARKLRAEANAEGAKGDLFGAVAEVCRD